MFNISETLKEHKSMQSIVYNDGVYIIKAICSRSSDHKIYFGLIKNLEDGTHQFCRVSMFYPEYINAEDEDLELDNTEKIILNSILRNRPFFSSLGGYTGEFTSSVWTNIISSLNYNHKDLDDGEFVWSELPLDLPIPDYTKLP